MYCGVVGRNCNGEKGCPKCELAAQDIKVETRHIHQQANGAEPKVSPSGKYLTCENRIYNYRAEMGKSHGYIKCGFCGEIIKVFIWSLAGSGKRCPCGAKHTIGITSLNIADAKAKSILMPDSFNCKCKITEVKSAIS
jgi:hypothetical protein